MAPFSSAKEKHAKLFNGDNEEDKRICSFGDRRAGGVHCRQQQGQVAFFSFQLKVSGLNCQIFFSVSISLHIFTLSFSGKKIAFYHSFILSVGKKPRERIWRCCDWIFSADFQNCRVTVRRYKKSALDLLVFFSLLLLFSWEIIQCHKKSNTVFLSR